MPATKQKVYGDTKVGRDGLTDKQRAFVVAYTDGSTAGNALQSYLAAGYAPGDKECQAAQSAWILLQRPHIQAAIKHYAETLAAEDGIGPDYVRRRLYRISKANMEGVLTVPLDGSDPQPDWVKLVECGGVEWIKKYKKTETYDDEGNREVKTEIELHDAVAALQILAKMFGLLNDKVIHTGPDGGPIQVETKMVKDIAGDRETFDLIDAAAQRLALKPRRAGESDN